jgi:hypothetical protein
MSDTYKLEGYDPAIRLALNADRGMPIEIVEWLYDEFYDIVNIMVRDEVGMNSDITLRGGFVRSCYLATKAGVVSWSKSDN